MGLHSFSDVLFLLLSFFCQSRPCLLVHSYVLVKCLVRRKDHEGAARLLARVSRNIDDESHASALELGHRRALGVSSGVSHALGQRDPSVVERRARAEIHRLTRARGITPDLLSRGDVPRSRLARVSRLGVGSNVDAIRVGLAHGLSRRRRATRARRALAWRRRARARTRARGRRRRRAHVATATRRCADAMEVTNGTGTAARAERRDASNA